MKKTDVIKYLDQLVDGYKAYMAACDDIWNVHVFIHNSFAIHVDDHIQILAEAVGQILNLYPRDSSNFMYEHSFTYKDVRFFQVDNHEELPEVVWDAD